MHKKIVFAVAACFTIAALFSCHSSKHAKTKRLPGVWQDKPITVDGHNTDWPSPYPEYDDKAMLGYAVSNDRENLYITVETGDEATQMKILKEGLTVWIDKKGEQNELTAINFPLPSEIKPGDAENRKRPSGGQWQQGQGAGGGSDQQEKKRMELEERVRALLPGAGEYSLQGFKSCNLQFPLMENDTCGIKVRIDIDSDNEMVWEAVVPLKTFYFKGEVSRPDRGKPISVCFETTGMKRPAGQNNGNHGNGGGGGMRPSFGMGGMGGMGMRMGSGGGGGRGGNHSAQTPDIMEPAYKSTKTWKTFGLAYPNQ
jgi:hypothetical protein